MPALLSTWAMFFQHLLDLLVDAGLQLAARIDADLARDIEQPGALRHLGAQAVLARQRHRLRIVKLDGHDRLPHVR